MNLPNTYFDVVSEHRPMVIRHVEQDVRRLQQTQGAPVAIGSVDEYDSCFNDCVTGFEDFLLASLPGFDDMPIALREQAREQLRKTNNPYLIRGYAGLTLEFHTFVNFIFAGKKTFLFSDNLADSLSLTEVNVIGNMVRLPYSSCQFVFTSPTVIDALYAIADPSERPVIDYNAPISVFVTALPEEPGASGQKLMITAWHASSNNDVYFSYKREIMLGRDWSLEECLKTDWEEQGDAWQGAGSKVDAAINSRDEPFYTDGLRFARTVLNAIIYLSSASPDISEAFNKHREIEDRAREVKTPSRKRKLLQSRRRHSGLDYQSVGASVGQIIVPPKGSEPEGRAAGATGSWVVLNRLTVRGHWRSQPHGPRSEKRKLIWIKPYVKGPDLAEVINKPYVVK